ncbi:MAG: GNAT family N-acetyltransferase [Bacteroidales bacterium]
MIVRDYHPDDFNALFQLWESLEMAAGERGDNPAIIRQTLEKGGKLLVLEDPGTGSIIGSSWMTFDGRRIFLHHFGIREDFQRKGLGTKLAVASLMFIKEKGYQVKLEVHKDNIAAIKLYEKAGFESFPDYDILMIRRPGEIEPENMH